MPGPSTPTRPAFTPALVDVIDKSFGFNTFNEPGLIRAHAETVRFYTDMANLTQPRWLTLLGPCGAGKTHLANAVWSAWKTNLRDHTRTRHGISARLDGKWIYWPQAVDRIRGGEYSLVPALEQADMAVIDDIGGEYDVSGFAASQLNRLANQRLGKWTIWTSNLSLDQIATKLDNRIADRLIRSGSSVIEMDTTSYSIREHNNNL